MTQSAEKAEFTGYDIIGDIHGCGKTLEQLLLKLGYVKRSGVYHYQNQAKPRQAIFVGDVVDRGPNIRLAVQIVHDMVTAGSAQLIMGNHEFNVIGYTTPAPAELEREFLRPHTPRTYRQIKETLDQFEHHPKDWKDYLAWFQQLPLFLDMEGFLDTEGFRVVHACWDGDTIDQFKAISPSHTLNDRLLVESYTIGTFACRCLNRLLCGIDFKLPNDQVIHSKDGVERKVFRVSYWEDQPKYYGDIAFQPDPLPAELSKTPISQAHQRRLVGYHEDEKPLFFGHYWRSGSPERLKPNIACLDYSAVKDGKLVAYRMDGEKQIDNSKFVWVSAQAELDK